MKNSILTFFGRLESEKGVDYLIDTAKQIKNYKLNATLAIFGEGTKTNTVLKISNNLESLNDNEILSLELLPNQIYYFGKRDYKTVILPFLQKKSDFSYLPGLMLETLGLSALESLKAGTNIIGYKHGALTDIILEQHNLFKYNVEEILNSPTLKKNSNYKFQTKENWLQELKKIIPNNAKKIALLNDYINLIGGAEKHLHQIAELLQNNGYEILIIAHKKNLESKLNEFKPDVIWIHNFLRVLKPKTLKTINQFKAFKIHTIHDLGLFTTFPSKFKNQELLPNSNSFKDFYKTKSAPYLIALYKWCKLIKPSLKELQQFNCIIVLHKFYQNSAKKYCKKQPIILQHFID